MILSFSTSRPLFVYKSSNDEAFERNFQPKLLGKDFQCMLWRPVVRVKVVRNESLLAFGGQQDKQKFKTRVAHRKNYKYSLCFVQHTQRCV